MNKWLIRIGLWLAKLGGWRPDIPTDLYAYTMQIVTYQNKHWPDRDGEAKRAEVYRQLLNRFPKESKRLLGRAIEEVCLDC